MVGSLRKILEFPAISLRSFVSVSVCATFFLLLTADAIHPVLVLLLQVFLAA